MWIEGRTMKWLGTICLLAGIARIGMTPASYIWGTDSAQELTFGYIACILMSVGSIVLYLVQERETGLPGLIGILGIIIGNVITTALVFVAFLTDTSAPMPDSPAVAVSGIVNMVGLLGGTILFMITTYRARVFPRWIVGLHVLMLLGMFIPLEDNKLFALFWGLPYIGMGYCILAGKLKQHASAKLAGTDREQTVSA